MSHFDQLILLHTLTFLFVLKKPKKICFYLFELKRKGENLKCFLLSASYKFSWYSAPENMCPTILHNKTAAKKGKKRSENKQIDDF